MIQVIRRPGGGWERQADGSKGAKLWHNVRGRRTLTQYGRDNLHDWYDLTIHVPCWEQELANPHHVHNAVPRQTWYPVSEQSLPGLTRMIANQRFDVIVSPKGCQSSTEEIASNSPKYSPISASLPPH